MVTGRSFPLVHLHPVSTHEELAPRQLAYVDTRTAYYSFYKTGLLQDL